MFNKKKFSEVLRLIKWYKILILGLHLFVCSCVFGFIGSTFFLDSLQTSDLMFREFSTYQLFTFALFTTIFQIMFFVIPYLVYQLIMEWCKMDLKKDVQRKED